jgi:hypothetical protein
MPDYSSPRSLSGTGWVLIHDIIEIAASNFHSLQAFAMTWGAVPWILSAELSSPHLREKSLALGAFSAYGVGESIHDKAKDTC